MRIAIGAPANTGFIILSLFIRRAVLKAPGRPLQKRAWAILLVHKAELSTSLPLSLFLPLCVSLALKFRTISFTANRQLAIRSHLEPWTRLRSRQARQARYRAPPSPQAQAQAQA